MADVKTEKKFASLETAKKINDDVTSLKEDIRDVDKIILGETSLKKVEFTPFAYGGYNNGISAVTNRIYTVLQLTNLSEIIYNSAYIAINYFVVKKDNYAKLYYTPNKWDTSGNVKIVNIPSFDEYSVIVIAKRNDGGAAFTSEKLALVNETTTIYKNLKEKNVDVVMFMGQSNMAGRGITSTIWPEPAPTIITGAGYEFRAISDPSRLYEISEPFGKNENKSGGINDGSMKTGSMVTAFVNSYYTHNGNIPVIGVSASKGGSKISQWQLDSIEGYLADAIQRLKDAMSYLNSNGYTIRHKYMLWCQGESDGDASTSESDFKSMFENMLNAMLNEGIEKLFMVRIGNCNISGSENRYTDYIKYETEIAQTNQNVVMVSCDFAGMKERGLMKDNFHYYQAGYNECGTYAGINTALYVCTGKEPTMYDTENGSLYYSHKN